MFRVPAFSRCCLVASGYLTIALAMGCSSTTDPSDPAADVSFDTATKFDTGQVEVGETGRDSGVDGSGSDTLPSDVSLFEVGTECELGSLLCATGCIDVRFDPRNCGACAKACAVTDLCNNSTCCPEGRTGCAGKCIDTTGDVKNCGACGKACAAGEKCIAGVCDKVCTGTTTKCDGTCVDLSSDPAHCGSCATACAGGARSKATCVRNKCGIVCETGFADCDGLADTGCEVDLATDPTHCGTCDIKCETGATCESKICVAPPLLVDFPSTLSKTNKGSLGGGALFFFETGDFVEQSFPRTAPASSLHLTVKMSNFTNASCPTTGLNWRVLLNDLEVGNFGWTTGPDGDKSIDKVFSFPSMNSIAGRFVVRYESNTSICSGGGSYSWSIPGTLELK